MEDSQEQLSCPICLTLLNDPVTTACGHTFCMICINADWDTGRRRRFSCPLCRQTFFPRPALKRNMLLAALIEEHKRKNRQNAAAGDTYAEPGDVQCDVCSGRKRKASMFCLVCLASYCETHLKPHYEVAPLKKHKLIKASAQIRDSICGRHDKLLEIYCRTDQQFICLLCVMGEHKGHDTVAVAEKKYEIQRQLERTKEEIAKRVLQMEKLRKAARSLRAAASEARGDFKRLCMEHECSVERKCSKMREKVGEAEKAGVDWTDGHLKLLKREKRDLRRRRHQIDQLALTEDPIQLFQGFQALHHLPPFTDSHESFDTLTEFVTAQKKKLKNMCDREKNELFSRSENNLLSEGPRLHEEIPSRTYLQNKYKNFRVEVDPDTVAGCLCLSDRNRQISWSAVDQAHPDHPDRFTFHPQALCKMGLQRSCYWEVEWDVGVVDLAVSYKGIKRKGSGNDCSFGHNKVSWKLTCSPSGCTFWHNNLHKGQIPPVHSRRAGVHLDYRAGTLRFFSVSDGGRFDLLHQIQTSFTEPLYPGFSVNLGATLKICDI